MILGADEIARYSRQIVLKQFGGTAQTKLKQTHITLIGAGGLGGIIALYLTGAGLGRLSIIDNDKVELSNLHRQIQFTQNDIGKEKAPALQSYAQNLNPHTHIDAHCVRIDAHTASAHVADCHLVIDATDNFPTRFAINAASRQANIPLLSGAIGTWEGQIALFNNTPCAPCYQCLVPSLPSTIQDCNTQGVLGPFVGIIASLMALEALKFCTAMPTHLQKSLLIYEGLCQNIRIIKLTKDPNCPLCHEDK